MEKNHIGHLLIEASAGTGKTQELAERLIALVAADIAPHEIVALTFSRAAAGEIFQRFVSLLAARAKNSAEDAKRLRQVIATQHLSQIGTIDSFLVRIARTFPLELGLDGCAEIMDDYNASLASSRTAFAVLRRTDAATCRVFADAFSLAMGGEDVRNFVEAYRKFIKHWHKHICSHPSPESWGDPVAIWGEAPKWIRTTEDDLARLAGALDGICDNAAWGAFVEWVRNFRGSFSGLQGFAKNFFALDGDALFNHATIDVSYRSKTYSFGGEQAQAIRDAIRGVCGYAICRQLALARGVFTLISAYETAYNAQVRARGRLVFDDVSRLLAQMPESVRLALEYRLDMKIGAWALDEFQDTSRVQWRAIGPLVEEAKQSDGAKPVFIVADRKQAIYGWRDGDIDIFLNEKKSAAYAHKPLNTTYRSSPAVVEAVNRVFVFGRLRAEFPGWEASEHVSAHKDRKGFVQVVTAQGRNKSDFFEPVLHALRAVNPVKRKLSAAILVRNNTFGEEVASYLRQNGVEGIVWEGESAICDTPALEAFLDLVWLADHPGYDQAYRHFATTPLAAAMYPEGIPASDDVSRCAAQAFTTKGLVRAFREMRALLPPDPSKAWSVFTEERFTAMLHAAAEFELSRDPGARLSDFVEFLKSKKQRDLAEEGKIRIMTIHRSKGLSFDYVILPLYERNALNAEERKVLFDAGWVLPDVDGHVARLVSVLSDVRDKRQELAEEEALCTYYVAMTRAKYAMTLVCMPAVKKTKECSPCYMSDFVREAIAEPIGAPDWYESVCVKEPRSLVAPEASRTFKRSPRSGVRRRLPSLALRTGMSAGDFFSDESPRQLARRRGTELHARFEAIEWIDPAAPKDEVERTILSNGWQSAFVKTPDVTALWRERGYEIFAGGKWESGQFDRVVFTHAGPSRQASIYDFKTNRIHAKESPEAFAHRMRETYARQMEAYRAAVVSLTGVAPAHVRTILLLVATGQQVEVVAEDLGHPH